MYMIIYVTLMPLTNELMIVLPETERREGPGNHLRIVASASSRNQEYYHFVFAQVGTRVWNIKLVRFFQFSLQKKLILVAFELYFDPNLEYEVPKYSTHSKGI